MPRRTALLCTSLALLLLTAGARADAPFIIVQSTTSTQNSGLFDHILPSFTGATGASFRSAVMISGAISSLVPHKIVLLEA